MFRGRELNFYKKNSFHLQLAQLLLAVGLLQWRLPVDSFHGNLPVYSSSIRGSLDALQLTPPDNFRDLTLSQSIHPKAVNVYFDELFDRTRLLARQASGRPFIAYIAEDESPSIDFNSVGGDSPSNETQCDSLTPEDADLIQVLWKQDVDLGIPFEDYRPSAQNLDSAEPVFEKNGEVPQVLPNESLKQSKVSDFKSQLIPSIDSETGEPIFEPLAGPSSLVNGAPSDIYARDQYTADAYLDSLLRSVGENDIMCGESDWNRATNYAGAQSSSPPLPASYNGTDPYGGVLLQNATLPNVSDAFALNSTTSLAAPNMTSGDHYSDLRKSTVTDHQALRDLLTFNSSTGNSSWDILDLFQGDFDPIPTNVSSISDTNVENQRYPTAGSGSSQTSTKTQNKVRKTQSRDGNNQTDYAGSDTGVSSMYSDEAPEEWSETSSNTSHDRDDIGGSTNYHSNSSMSFGSMEASAQPQKKYKLFGRRGYNDVSSEYPGENILAEPQRLPDSMHGLLHNHSYGQHNEFAANLDLHCMKLESYETSRNSLRRSTESSQNNDGYLSSDPSESSAFAQVTSARDERRARDLNIPIAPEEIVTLSIDDFNERLARLELTEEQQSLIRDIRRRGKNKVAAQNCRKRKLDQISSLQGEVDALKETCSNLESENHSYSRLEARAQHKLGQLRNFLSRSGAIPKQHTLKL